MVNGWAARNRPLRSLSAFVCLPLLLALLYSLQLASPLRLEPDSVAYLQLAQSAASGLGFTIDGVPSYFPPGYPAVLTILLSLGAASPRAILALNLLALLVAAVCSFRLYRDAFGWHTRFAVLVVCLWLLSWVVIKHSAMPLSECLFTSLFLATLTALAAALRSAPLRSLACLFLAASLAIAALCVRTIGLALLPVTLWTAWLQFRRQRHLRAWYALLAALLLISTAAALRSTAFHTYSRKQQESTPLATRLNFRLLEAGEVLMNTTSAKLARLLPPVLFRIAGFALVVCLVAAAWLRRRHPHPADVAFGAYLALLFSWPYYDSRFWMPVIPWIAAYLTFLAARFLPRPATAAYLLFLGLTGLAALAYSISLAFSGDSFPDRFGGGSRRAEYCAALFRCPENPSLAPPDPAYVKVLRTFR